MIKKNTLIFKFLNANEAEGGRWNSFQDDFYRSPVCSLKGFVEGQFF